MEKKGQVTLFIIIGVTIILSLLVVFLFKSEVTKSDLVEPSNIGLFSTSVQNYIEGCVKNTAEEALIFVGERGGYYQLPEIADEDLGAPYYFYDKDVLVPSKEQIEMSLANYLDSKLFFCIQNFAAFEKSGLEINQGEIVSNAKISKKKVLFDVTFPVTVVSGVTENSLARFSKSISSNLDIFFETSNQIVNNFVKVPSSVCVSCNFDLATENDLQIITSPFGNSSVRFTLIDKEERLPEEFNFLVKLEEGESFFDLEEVANE